MHAFPFLFLSSSESGWGYSDMTVLEEAEDGIWLWLLPFGPICGMGNDATIGAFVTLPDAVDDSHKKCHDLGPNTVK